MSICWWCMYEARIFKISLLFKHHPPSSMLIILFVYMSRHCSRPLHCQTSLWSLRSNWLLPSVSKEEIFFRYCQQALMMMASELWASWNSSQTKSLRSQFFVDFSLIPLLLGHIKDHKTSFCRKVRDEKNTHENLKLLLLFGLCWFSYARPGKQSDFQYGTDLHAGQSLQRCPSPSRLFGQWSTQHEVVLPSFAKVSVVRSVIVCEIFAVLGFVPSFGYRPKSRTKTGRAPSWWLSPWQRYEAMHRCCWASDARTVEVARFHWVQNAVIGCRCQPGGVWFSWTSLPDSGGGEVSFGYIWIHNLINLQFITADDSFGQTSIQWIPIYNGYINKLSQM